MSKPELHTNYDGSTYYEKERRFWMWKEKEEEKTIFHYAQWKPEDISYRDPNVEEFQDFIISSKDITEVAPYKCSYEHDFVQIQPFEGLKESTDPAHDIVPNPLSSNGKESMKTAHDSVPNQYSVGFKQFLGTAKVEKMVLMAKIHTYAHHRKLLN
jgi:hypothetical protein